MKNIFDAYMTHKKIAIPVTVLVAVLIHTMVQFEYLTIWIHMIYNANRQSEISVQWMQYPQ